jgi:hypothetical protein
MEELAGGFGLAVRLSAELDGIFRSRIEALPQQTRRLLLVAGPPAASSTGCCLRPRPARRLYCGSADRRVPQLR